MRRFIVLAAAALSFSACSPGGSPVTYSKINRAEWDAEWARNNAHADEQIKLHQEAVAKWQANRAKELETEKRWDAERATRQATAVDPSYNRATLSPSSAQIDAEQAGRQQAQAADAQCKFAAQQAYMQVDIARPSLLGLEAVGYRNMTYRSCMQAHGYAIPGGSGGPAPTLSDVFN